MARSATRRIRVPPRAAPDARVLVGRVVDDEHQARDGLELGQHDAHLVGEVRGRPREVERHVHGTARRPRDGDLGAVGQRLRAFERVGGPVPHERGGRPEGCGLLLDARLGRDEEVGDMPAAPRVVVQAVVALPRLRAERVHRAVPRLVGKPRPPQRAAPRDGERRQDGHQHGGGPVPTSPARTRPLARDGRVVRVATPGRGCGVTALRLVDHPLRDAARRGAREVVVGHRAESAPADAR